MNNYIELSMNDILSNEIPENIVPPILTRQNAYINNNTVSSLISISLSTTQIIDNDINEIDKEDDILNSLNYENLEIIFKSKE